ncbi:hypothetical protein J6590_008209 [Homalodisca vitripennis]|nr:hypothetical protein J6590_008209 [Homalodisca vitripennis]
MYPRNVTCYLTLRQKTVPICKHAMISVRQESEHKMKVPTFKDAMISVRQESEHKMQIRSTMLGMNKTTGSSKEIRAWTDCTGERDQLIFYDGASTDDTVLAKYCGGAWLPSIISRGPSMLVAFHSSPFSVPLRSDGATSPLRGFELEVDVLFSDSSSLDYSKYPRKSVVSDVERMQRVRFELLCQTFLDFFAYNSSQIPGLKSVAALLVLCSDAALSGR